MSVPAPFEAVFARAERNVARYFRRRLERPERGTFSISGERYVLVRAASMSVEFFDLVTSLYRDKGKPEARRVANNLLFDMAHAIGKADARAFQRKLRLRDPIARLSAGPVHFAFSGWAFVSILPDSRPAPDESYFLVYDHPFSFEADAWRRRRRRSPFPVCIMNSGYSSGWCEASFGLPLVAVEIECRAAGARRCRFIMAPPSRIERHLRRYAGPRATGRRGGGPGVSIPEFFQRKRLEEELRQAARELELRVRARTAELLAANERLRTEVAERRRAEEARDEFLSVAAHELKTPLTSLRGFAQLLMRQLDQDEAPGPAKLRQALSAMDQQSAKLARLVGQLLDVSRIEAGRLLLEAKVTDVMALVESAVETARANSFRHSFRVEAPAAALAWVDPLRLEQVLTNLLDNAVKYSPDGGEVVVEVAKRKGESLRLAVTDHGLGIAPQRRSRIFDRFYQAHPDQRIGGMGLGLYISRQIVELHGGSIAAEFPPGGGTRMVVTLPAGRPAEARA